MLRFINLSIMGTEKNQKQRMFLWRVSIFTTTFRMYRWISLNNWDINFICQNGNSECLFFSKPSFIWKSIKKCGYESEFSAFLAVWNACSDIPCENRCNFVENEFTTIIFHTVLHWFVRYLIFQTDLKSVSNCGLWSTLSVFFDAGGINYSIHLLSV